MLAHRFGRLHQKLHVVGEQPRHCRAAALVRHMGHLNAGLHRHDFADQMQRVADAGRAEKIFLWFRAGQRDELAQGVGLDRAVDDDQRRVAANQAGGDEIALRVVGRLGVEIVGNGERRRCRKQQRVAVGRRARHRERADLARGTADVFDQQLLAPFLGEQLRDQTPDDVGAAAGGRRHDQPDWA